MNPLLKPTTLTVGVQIQRPPVPRGNVRKCLLCGCSEARACPGGCGWSSDPRFCTRCASDTPFLALRLSGMNVAAGPLPEGLVLVAPCDTVDDAKALARILNAAVELGRKQPSEVK